MHRYLNPLAAFVLLTLAVHNVHSFTESPEQRYFKSLVQSGYDFTAPPEGNNGGAPVDILVTMYILDVSSVSIYYSTDFQVQFYFRQSWNDSRLAFDEKDMKIISVNSPDMIWTPDLFFSQEKSGTKHEIIKPNRFIKIKPNGEVLYSTRLSIVFSCPMNLKNYPHDVHECRFSAESYGFTAEKINLAWDERKGNPVGAANPLSVVLFDLAKITHSSRTIAFSSANYSMIEVNLTLKHKPGFYVFKLYVPYVFLVVLSWLSFWITPKLTALRLTLLLVLMYFMMNIHNDVSYYAPMTPYAKAIDVWTAFCMSLVFGAFVEYILVKIILLREMRNKKMSLCDPEIVDDKDGKIPLSSIKAQDIASPATFISNPCNGNLLSSRIDAMSKILFPILFVLFNVIFWPVYV